jgi:hypothetical protein
MQSLRGAVAGTNTGGHDAVPSVRRASRADLPPQCARQPIEVPARDEPGVGGAARLGRPGETPLRPGSPGCGPGRSAFQNRQTALTIVAHAHAPRYAAMASSYAADPDPARRSASSSAVFSRSRARSSPCSAWSTARTRPVAVASVRAGSVQLAPPASNAPHLRRRLGALARMHASCRRAAGQRPAKGGR